MSNKKLILVIFLILLVFGVLVVFVFDLNCIFKEVFHLPCPGCGLTRGFRALFHGSVVEAINYNILTIPIFLFLVSVFLVFIKGIIQKNNLLENYLLLYTKKQVIILIIIFVLISWIFNLIEL